MATDVVRLDLNEWRRELAKPLTSVFGGTPQISLLCPPKAVADDTSKFLVRDAQGEPRGVVLCSSFVDPDMVAHGMERARSAQRAVKENLKTYILEPLLEGRCCGLSYALLPYCGSLSGSRVVNRIQRTVLGPALFRWLRRSAQATVSEPSAGVDHEIDAALEALEKTQGMSRSVRAAAEQALNRLHNGLWIPRRVLMHGDFWLGNILLRSKEMPSARRSPWWDRFVVIDWAGSRLDGFAFWDLFRLAQSVRASNRRLSHEVVAWARMFDCDPTDARSYLAAALGDLGLHLNHFPVERFVELADSVMRDADRVLVRG
jgi:hypothetical protein